MVERNLIPGPKFGRHLVVQSLVFTVIAIFMSFVKHGYFRKSKPFLILTKCSPLEFML